MTEHIRKRKNKDDYAIFLPSISPMYAVSHGKGWPREPIEFKRLNFLDEANKDILFYPYALYSAGHAKLDPENSDLREPMIQGRDRHNTIVVGDSGGFQAATGVLKFDWENPMGEKANEMRMKLLRWLEHTADYSMILDWPAWAIDTGRLPETLMKADPTTDPLTVTNDPFNNCLKGTIWNNEFFIKNRVPGATQFLNVLQGRSYEEANIWYDAVVEFSSKEKYGDRAFEGWAFGGSTGGDPSVTIRNVIRLRDDGYLDGDDRWIHVLGRSRPQTAVYLTMLNRGLKRHINENIQVSYDAASSFLYTVNGKYLVDFYCNPAGMNLVNADVAKDYKYVDSKDPFVYDRIDNRISLEEHYRSKISEILTMGDLILCKDPETQTTRMDTASYMYYMAHNLDIHINALNTVCSYIDRPDRQDLLPAEFIEYEDFLERVLTSETPMSIIESESEKFSNLILGSRVGSNAFEDTEIFDKCGNIDFSKKKKEDDTVGTRIKWDNEPVFDEFFA